MNLSTYQIAASANAAARDSSRMGAPMLAEDSSLPVLVDWLGWNDPNGAWAEAFDDDNGFTAVDAWCEIATMLDGAS